MITKILILLYSKMPNLFVALIMNSAIGQWRMNIYMLKLPKVFTIFVFNIFEIPPPRNTKKEYYN